MTGAATLDTVAMAAMPEVGTAAAMR